MDYADFLRQKEAVNNPEGFDVEIDQLNQFLFPFQKFIVKWAVKRGRCAIFADCGLGKTLMQLAWADEVLKHRGKGAALIVTPLAVAEQTIREAEKFGITARHIKSHRECDDKGINIINYERIHHLSQATFAAIVLDESSILKSHDGKYRQMLTEYVQRIPYRLACSATPSPNDHMELGTHSEFLGVMKREEMLAMFFTHDGGETSKWRLKRHGVRSFWQWLASWAIAVRRPSDIGFDDEGYDLPPLRIHDHVTESKSSDFLFPVALGGLQERRKARRESLNDRVSEAVRIVESRPDEQWVVWTDLNSESQMIANAIPDAVEVTGSDSNEKKEIALRQFTDREIRVLVSKPSIAGFGMNWQSCRNVVFAGVTDSFEAYYQAIRRCWRFGQANPVDAHIIYSDLEGDVRANVIEKQSKFQHMMDELVKNMGAELAAEVKREDYFMGEIKAGDGWEARRGDCVELIKQLDDDSIHYSIFSPPFASLYTYTDSHRDMGNCRDHSEFYSHFDFLVRELYRVLMPGRLLSFHCMNLPTSKSRDGVIGITDFRGRLISLFEQHGFIYHSEVTIWKDPVTAMQRTKALGLLHKQLKKDSAMSRQGIADYLVTMRKPGDNPEPVSHTNESFPVSLWQKYASPVWMDINPSDTLQFRNARDNNDERHICPLQLEVIERGVELWTNPGDTVLSPFMGIGSEGYVSIKRGRSFIGFELKQSYYDCAVKNLKSAEHERNADQCGLFENLQQEAI